MHSSTSTRLSGLGPIPAPDVIGSSPALKRVLRVAERLAAGDSKVLITGESGVGKDVIARVVHTRSPRASPVPESHLPAGTPRASAVANRPSSISGATVGPVGLAGGRIGMAGLRTRTRLAANPP